jgi:tryptophanyl-tRNA synthetase
MEQQRRQGCLSRQQLGASIQGKGDTKERLRHRIMNITSNAIALGLDSEASGTVNA